MLGKRFLSALILLCFALIPYGGASATPKQPISTDNVSFLKLDAGYATNCAITSTNRLVCWGDNYEGQLGVDNSDLYYSPIPLHTLTFGENILGVTSGGEHSCAIDNANQAWCWGNGEYGQLGNDAEESSFTPVQVSTDTGFSNPGKISAGDSTTCGINSVGAAYCWGSGGSGIIGNGTNESYDVPMSVTTLTSGVKDISVGYNAACAVNSTDGAMCWGNNTWGILGNGTNTSSNVPVAVSGLSTGVLQVSVGDLHACALVSGGMIKCWGYNAEGYLGNGGWTNSNVPVNVSGITSGATAISVGSYHTCALVNGGVKCWGDNYEGQLGDGTTVNKNTPVQVIDLTSGVIAIAAGGYHSCALLATGEIKCWGTNGEGELGTGDFDDRLVPGEPVVSTTGNVSGYSVYLGTRYSSNHNIFISAHPSLVEPPDASDVIANNEYYLLTELPDGSYYISAFLDVDDSGGGPPGPGEPTAFYDADDDGNPDPITIAGGSSAGGINIFLYDPPLLYMFLPVIVK